MTLKLGTSRTEIGELTCTNFEGIFAAEFLDEFCFGKLRLISASISEFR